MLAILATLLPHAFSAAGDALRLALQAELDLIAAEHAHPLPLALGLGWASADASFGLASGTVPAVDGSPARPATASDTFLFGSGTKPFTSVAVLRLAEAGALSLDDLAAAHVDPLLWSENGTSLCQLFGPLAASVTVRHLLTMQSGLADFDTPALDAAILDSPPTVSWSPYALLRAAAATAMPGVHFVPGSRVEYSSTNFILAGLLLLAHSPTAAGDWQRLDMHPFVFPPPLRAKYNGVGFVNDQLIREAGATVAGQSGMGQRAGRGLGERARGGVGGGLGEWAGGGVGGLHLGLRDWLSWGGGGGRDGNVTSGGRVVHSRDGSGTEGGGGGGNGPGAVVQIWEQRGGMLGWTCGNLVATPFDVARFFRDLLVDQSVVSAASLREMEAFRLLDYGWAKGSIRYGAGLMIESVELPDLPPVSGAWDVYEGHGGDTYGFLSEQGVIRLLGNATFSVVSNQDYDGNLVQHTIACRIITAAARVLLGVVAPLECGKR